MKRVTRFRDRPAHRRSSRWPWTLPPRSGYLRRACPDCYQIDPDLMHQLIGDGYGPGREFELTVAAVPWTARSAVSVPGGIVTG